MRDASLVLLVERMESYVICEDFRMCSFGVCFCTSDGFTPDLWELQGVPRLSNRPRVEPGGDQPMLDLNAFGLCGNLRA